MVDMKKVIEGLECHAEVNCVECPYRDGWRTRPFGETLLADALILLKEQEYKDRMFHALEEDWKRLKEQEEEVKAAYRRGLESGRTIKWD